MFLLPSFFKTLVELKKQNRQFSVVIRTYGDDMDELVACINAFSQGKHLPKYYLDNNNRIDLSDFYIAKENVWKGRYDENDGMFKLQNKYNGKQIISDENEALKVLQGDSKNENISIYADIEVNYTMGNPGILIFLNSTKQEESRI